MLLRTLEVPDAHGHVLNAVVLCAFAAAPDNQKFLVYSLNEKSDDDLVKIYLTSVEGNQLQLSMCDAAPEMLKLATQVLKVIFQDACTTEPKQTDDSYTLLDLNDTDIQCNAINTHYSLKVSDAWLLSLMQYNPQAEASDPPVPLQAPVNAVPVTTYGMNGSIDAPLVKLGEKTTSDKIEANIKSLIASVTNHKETLLSKYVQLEDRQRQLEEWDQLLMQRESAVQKREDDLLTIIKLLQEGEKQLNGLMGA
ncbi:hypothetical protein [Pseudomonas sp. OST1909]|uniref:hypothetical protein n=1 Tax=Pseudomonas sp. OST1909 TaxID=2777367 RepID=UPI0018896498|nr:hypothetical protein [Pseudomonas sp. OST1909]QOY73630.1 hypothetical protein IH404_11460 [Pseudomonas sp. OST1909]